MAEIVNLTRARKDRAKAQRTREAEANRAKHGRTRAQREADAAEAARRDGVLDGAKRE